MKTYLIVTLAAVAALAIVAVAHETQGSGNGYGMMGPGYGMMGGGYGMMGPGYGGMMGPGYGMMGGGYGMYNNDPEKAKTEIADFYYPGSTIMNSAVCYMMGPNNVMVFMSTTDSLDKVMNYYQPMFNGNDVSTAKGPNYYNWTRPERSVKDSTVPAVSVNITQSYSGKETIISVYQGFCAYMNLGRHMGGGMMGGGWMRGMMGGYGE
jgi:hypothetical protein